MDPTPFLAALITAGEFSRKSTKDERGKRLDCETIIIDRTRNLPARHGTWLVQSMHAACM